jgi:hypothetical protein
LSWKREELKDFQDEIYQYAMRSSFANGGGVEFIEYKQNEIMYSSDLKEYYVDDEQFKTLEEAKAYIDNGSPISDWKKDAYRRGMFKTGGGVDEIEKIIDHDFNNINGFTKDPVYKKGNILVQRIGGSTIWSVAIDNEPKGRILNAFTQEQAFKKVEKEMFANGGGVDDADWIEESLIDLQNEVDMDDLVVDYSNNSNSYVASNGDAEFLVFESENDAREQAIERVKEDLEENPEYFSKDWLMDYVDGKDFFTEVYNDWNIGYVNDIENEDSDKYANRLIEEMVENGIVSSEEAKEDDFDAEDYKNDFVNLRTSESIEEGNDGLDYYIDNFGEEQAFKFVSDNNLIDIDKASEDAVDTDGVAHFLSSYDGEQIDLSNGHVAYRTN